MKKILLALVVSSVVAVAEEPRSLFDGFNFGAFAYTETQDFDNDARFGYGTKAGYFPFENVGVESEVFIFNPQESFVDRVNLNLVFRAPIGKNFAFLPFIGIGRQFEDQDSWGHQIGLGSELRVWKQLFLDSSVRWINDSEDVQDTYGGSLGLKWKL